MKIYSFKIDSSNGDNLVSILEKNNIFTAITFSQSRDFKTLKGAKNWLAKKGWYTPVKITTFSQSRDFKTLKEAKNKEEIKTKEKIKTNISKIKNIINELPIFELKKLTIALNERYEDDADSGYSI